jgi:hypothetical protein
MMQFTHANEQKYPAANILLRPIMIVESIIFFRILLQMRLGAYGE